MGNFGSVEKSGHIQHYQLGLPFSIGMVYDVPKQLQ